MRCIPSVITIPLSTVFYFGLPHGETPTVIIYLKTINTYLRNLINDVIRESTENGSENVIEIYSQ